MKKSWDVKGFSRPFFVAPFIIFLLRAILKKKKGLIRMLKNRIIKCLLITLLIAGAVLFLAHYANTGEIDRKAAKLVFYEIYH